MRTAIWLVALFVLLCGGAWADLCPKCVGMMYTMDVGVCKVCGGGTSSGAHPLCGACSKKLNQCEHCRGALNAAAAKEVKPVALAPSDSERPATVDTNVSGAYESGKWKYDYTIGAKGSRSERRSGALTFDGKPIAGAAASDRIKTPWGVMQYFGDPVADRGWNSGWLLKQTYDQPLDEKKGRMLPAPDAAATLTAERKKALVDDVENFSVTLRYHGPEDKPFSWLTLCRRMQPRTAVYQFELTGIIDKDVALKVIDWLETSGALGHAYDPRLVDAELPGPCYRADFTVGKVLLRHNLGWELPMAQELTRLRGLLTGDAAKQMDVLMGRLSGYIKEWTGKPYEPPKDAAAAVEGPATPSAEGRAWTKLFEDEAWYKRHTGKEEVFSGTLVALTDASHPPARRTRYYALGDRMVWTAGLRSRPLDDLVGKKVEIRGKAVHTLEGLKAFDEVWPAAVREATGADAAKPAAGAKLDQTPDGNVVLYVSNQSSALTPVDVKVTIDGRAAVDESFDQAGGHNWKKFVFALAKGPHELKVVSVKGEAALTQKFEVKDKHWAVLDYWHDPRAAGGAGAKKQFTFRIQDTPIYFM
jgi:hypothetical protein